MRETYTDYNAYDVQWNYVQDSNTGTYSNGFVNFTNASLIGASQDRYWDLKNAYVQIPYYAVVAIGGGGSFGSSNDAGTNAYQHLAENCFALSPKSDHQHIIDLVSAKLNGVSLNRQSQYTNLMMTEDLKKQSADHERMFHECCSLDSADGYKLNAAVLETNNDTVPLPNVLQTGLTNAGGFRQNNLSGGYGSRLFYNDAIQKRLFKNNFDMTDPAVPAHYSVGTYSDSLFYTGGTSGFTNTALINSLQCGFMGAYRSGTSPGNAQTGLLVPDANAVHTAPVDRLLFQYVANIPLASICDVYAKMPSVASLANFELRLQLNIASNNSWTASFTAPAIGAGMVNLIQPTSVTSNQSVGTTCPFMLSPVAVCNDEVSPFGTGCVVSSPAGNFTITVTPGIGYVGQVANINSIPTGGGIIQGCRIWIPQYGFTSEYSAKILDSPKKLITYKDYYVDTIPNITSNGTQQVSKLFVANLSHVRNIYIIPYLSPASGVTTAVPVLRSLLSSAPTTCSFCRLSNVNLQIGGQNVMNENLQLSNQFYENNMFQALAMHNGNSFSSELITGLVTRSMYQKCYGVLSFDLKRISDEVQDDSLKSFMLNFKIDTKGTYDFVVLVTYDNSVVIDRLGGSVSSASDM
jgi:hypothetical protein